MQKIGLSYNLGGALRGVSYQFNAADLQLCSGSGAQTFGSAGTPTGFVGMDLFPQGSFILRMQIYPSAAFAGPSLTDMKVRVGKAGAATNFFANDFDVFQTPSTNTLVEIPLPPIGQIGPFMPTVTFTPTGSVCQSCSGGQVNIDMQLFDCTTPTFTGLYMSQSVL